MDYVLETTQLTKVYGRREAVDHVDLRIPKGKIYGFLGPNGAGKTTTIRMLLGLIKPSTGGVKMFGRSFSKYKLSMLSRIGSLVENPSYYAHLNAVENLEVYRILQGAPKARIPEVLDLVGLSGAKRKKVKNYSLGMKQRLGIAMALLGSPELLILDEPTNGLDPEGIHEIRRLIQDLSAKNGITILVSSHLLSEIDQIADYVGIISKGRLVFQDQIDILRQRSQTTVHFEVDKTEKALQYMLNSGLAANRDELGIAINQADNRAVAKAVKTMVDHDISVFRVEEKKHSLEDIFLDVIREEEAHV